MIITVVLIGACWKLCDVRLVGVEVRADEAVEIDSSETGRRTVEVAQPALASHRIAIGEPVAECDCLLSTPVALLD
jgi:hypothetical protein